MQVSSIQEFAKTLKLSYCKENIKQFLLEAASEEYELEKALEILFSREIALRKSNTIKRYIKSAKFPYVMNFEMLKRGHLSPSVVKEIKNLETLEFIDCASNVVLVGNPGVGKTALAISIGMKACEAGMKVMFVNVSDLIIQIKEAMSLNELTHYKRNFERCNLVILDDLGYCSFNKECGEVLFNLLSGRNEKGSMVITTNLTFNRWNEVFCDQVLTGAIIDRIAFKAHVIDMTGDSYRVVETQRWLSEKKKR